MEVKEYEGIIKKTAIFPSEFGTGYCMLGLTGEFEELLASLSSGNNDRINKEAGDVFWYITALCNEYGFTLSQFWKTDFRNYGKFHKSYIPIIHKYIGELAEVTKKYYRDKTVDLDKVKPLLDNLISNYQGFLYSLDANQYHILQKNYEKLIKRRKTGTLHGSGDNREEVQSNN